MLKKHNKYKNIYKTNNQLLKFGRFGLKTIEYIKITNNQSNYLLILLKKKLKKLSKKKIKIFFNIINNQTLTKLSLESRMGKGKGSVLETSCYFKPGMIFCELEGASYKQIKELNKFILRKLFIKFKIIYNFNN